MRHEPYPSNFIYPDIKPEHYRFGANNAGDIIRENGDFRDFVPLEYEQRRNIESSACYKLASLNGIATIQEEEFGLPNQQYSPRFNDQENATPEGGDPLKFADSAREDGLIPEGMLPFSDEIDTWEKFNSFFGGNEKLCRVAGKQFSKKWKINNYIVFERWEPIEVKYKKLREALKRSPVPMSVYAWIEKDGIYVKPQGLSDTHLVLCVYLDEQNRPYFWDTYEPHLKIGEPFYNSEFAMRWTVKKITEPTVEFNILMRLIQLLKSIGIKFGKLCSHTHN